jgi:hypothetical protein
MLVVTHAHTHLVPKLQANSSEFLAQTLVVNTFEEPGT